MNPYTESVSRGADLLDKEHPGWRDKIDLFRLDVSKSLSCILGQIFEHHDCGLSVLWNSVPSEYPNYTAWVTSKDIQTVAAHGFTIDPSAAQQARDIDEEFVEWRALQDAWVAELAPELAARVPMLSPVMIYLVTK